MNKKTILLMSLPALIVLVAMSALTYNTSYDLGISRGYSNGYDVAMGTFPRLECDNVTFTNGSGGTVSFEQLTITGEQDIIDTIKALPSWGFVRENSPTGSRNSISFQGNGLIWSGENPSDNRTILLDDYLGENWTWTKP